MPTRPKPSVDYVKHQRAKARPKEQAAPEIALCINGGGLTPPAEMYGVFRGLVKRKVAPRKSPNCNNALDNFDVISGASGGYIAATMYCYSKEDPCCFLGAHQPSDPSAITSEMMASKPALYGEMCTKPAICCPLSTCCLPVTAWALIDMAFGIPLRALGCGKWVGCGQYPCATGSPLAWVEFMYNNFVKPLGIRRGSTEPPCRSEAPTPLGVVTMASLADAPPGDYYRTVQQWQLKAWQEVFDETSAREKMPGIKQFNTVNVQGLTLGCPVKTGLEFQWADGQSGDARGLSLIPYVLTPDCATTKYSPLPLGTSNPDKQMHLPQKCCGSCLTQRTALFDATSVAAQSFILPPVFKPFGVPPTAYHLSPETSIAFSGDAPGAILAPLGSPFASLADMTFRIQTAPQQGKEETCRFIDGARVDNTAIASTVAKGARSVVAVITNFGLSPFDQFGNLRGSDNYIQNLLALFGAGTAPPATPAQMKAYLVMNQIFNNDEYEDNFDRARTKALAPPRDGADWSYDRDGADWMVGRPLEALVEQLKDRFYCGEPLVATLAGLKVIDNPYHGTSAKQGSVDLTVDLTVILYSPPKRWMDLINRNPELNPEAKDYVCAYPDADAVVTGMKPLGLYPVCPFYPAKHNVFDKDNGKAPFKNFPKDVGMFPVTALSDSKVNLCGYCGDYIVEHSALLDRLFKSDP